MKLNQRILIAAALLAAAIPAWADKAPVRAAALDRPALQSPRASKMAILAVARAGKRVLAAGERGIILYSDDSGHSWQQAQVPTSVSLTAIRFVNEHAGWAVGHMGVVLHTEDGGQTWVKQFDGFEAARLALEAAQKSGDKRAIRDATWLVADGADKPFFDICFLNDHTMYIVGAYNLMFRSDDGGKSWTSWQQHVPNPRGLHLYSMRAVGHTLFIAGEQGLLLRSEDQGQHFLALKSPYAGSWFGMVAGRKGDLLAYGLRGNAYLTRDLGKHWRQATTGTQVSLSAGVELADGRIVLVNQAGEVFVSSDQGASFQRAPDNTRLPLSAVVQAPDGLVLGSLRGVRTISLPDR
jgi:photosystem II stability/assembly factor-like uncharacterized protein